MKAVLLFIVLTLLGCLSTQKQIKSLEPGGEALYRAKCSVCHRLYAPSAYTYDRLQEYVKKYGGVLTDGERRDLLNYLRISGFQTS